MLALPRVYAAGNALSLSLAPSRVSGVAPLAVFFDATGTTDASVTSEPFHDLRYTWDFGDPAGGAVWSTSGRSKNAAEGPMATHVFEAPGTYAVTLTVYDGRTTAQAMQQIEVSNPDDVFSGTATRCFANASSPDWSGCPAGATRVADSSDFGAAINRNLATNRRLLFKRGDTWFTSGAAVLDANGPWTIDAFGSGAKPVVRQSAGSTMIQISANRMSFRDARVMNLDIDGAGSSAVCVSASGNFDNLLFLRVDARDSGTGFLFAPLTIPSMSVQWDGLAFVETTAKNISARGGNGFFVGGRRLAVLGSSALNSLAPGEHNFRAMFLDKAVIAENIFSGAAPTKHNLAIRAPDWHRSYPALPENTYTQHVLVSGNSFGGGSGVTVPVAIATDPGTALTPHDQRVRHMILERNWWHGGASTFAALALVASYASVRNNVIDMSASSSGGQNAMVIAAANQYSGAPGPTSNWIYNNTAYSSAALKTFRIVYLRAGSSNSTVRNNLGYAPNAMNGLGVVNEATATSASHNSSSSQVRGTSPKFVSMHPATAAAFRPVGGYAVGGGTAVPVWSDYFATPQPNPRDLGAVNHRRGER